jgi:hypothetical protein
VSPAAASGDPERVDVIAVDWSGALRGERRKIWLAEVADGLFPSAATPLRKISK